MLLNILRREQSLPLQAAPAEVEQQQHVAIRAGEVINALRDLVVGQRESVRLVLNEQVRTDAVIGPVGVDTMSLR